MDEMWAFLDVDDEHENMAPQQSKQIETESNPKTGQAVLNISTSSNYYYYLIWPCHHKVMILQLLRQRVWILHFIPKRKPAILCNNFYIHFVSCMHALAKFSWSTDHRLCFMHGDQFLFLLILPIKQQGHKLFLQLVWVESK